MDIYDDNTFEKINKKEHHRSLPNRNRFGLCQGKKVAFTKQAAKQTARALNEKYGVDHKLYIYKCPHGSGHYHLTKMPRSLYRSHERRY